MDKINFEDLPSQNSPINAKNLNQVQANVEAELDTKANNEAIEQTLAEKSNKGTVLYEDEKGTMGNVTLSESSANFSYIEIYYRRDTSYELSIKVSNPNGKQAKLQEIGGQYLYFSIIVFVEDIIETGGYSRQVAILDGTQTTYETNAFYITKVVGYKN